jgi:PPOX class probable F420-dependent enzyme
MAYHRMTEDEVRDFLSSTPPRTAKLATTREDGRPHVAPIWFDLDGSDIVFTTGRSTVKGRNLVRDRRVAVCVDDDRPPFSFVLIEGAVEISEDADELLAWATRIAGRYMGDDQAEAYGRRNGVPGELLIKVRPQSVASGADLAM